MIIQRLIAYLCSFRALPITQHERIWKLYIEFVNAHDIPETAVRVFRRYLQLCPESREEFVEYLINVGRLDDAAIHLAKIVNDNDFVSKNGKSNHNLWYELCELISKNPHKIQSLDVDAIIRGGLRYCRILINRNSKFTVIFNILDVTLTKLGTCGTLWLIIT